jgi:hypothetical protein
MANNREEQSYRALKPLTNDDRKLERKDKIMPINNWKKCRWSWREKRGESRMALEFLRCKVI